MDRVLLLMSKQPSPDSKKAKSTPSISTDFLKDSTFSSLKNLLLTTLAYDGQLAAPWSMPWCWKSGDLCCTIYEVPTLFQYSWDEIPDHSPRSSWKAPCLCGLSGTSHCGKIKQSPHNMSWWLSDSLQPLYRSLCLMHKLLMTIPTLQLSS